MLAEIKKCVDSHDIKGLRYVFVDCLDVDPTFEKYKADYEYCKRIDGLFEAYQELSGLASDDSRWTRQYWDQLKLDLMKNFSEKRFEHMVKVAKSVYADKIARLLSERSAMQQAVGRKIESVPPIGKTVDIVQAVDAPKQTTAAEMQEKRLAEMRKALETKNQRIEAKQRAQRVRREAAQREDMARRNDQMGSTGSKKRLGIVLAIAVAVLKLISSIVHTMKGGAEDNGLR